MTGYSCDSEAPIHGEEGLQGLPLVPLQVVPARQGEPALAAHQAPEPAALPEEVRPPGLIHGRIGMLEPWNLS